MAGLNKVKRVISSVLGELPIQEGGGTFNPSGSKRETKVGEVAENTGYVEATKQATLKLKLNASIDPQDFRDVDNDTLTIVLSGGGQHVMPGAWVTEVGDLSGGEFEVTYESAKSQKLI